MSKYLSIILIILFSNLKGFSQENSTYFLDVINSKEYNNEQKEIILDSLFFDLNYNNFYDIHEYSKWNWKNGNLKKAISINKLAIRRKGLQKPENINVRKKIIKNLGYFNYLINEYYTSLYYYHQATLINGLEVDSAKAYKKMGQIFFKLGDYYNAEKYYDKALMYAKTTNLNLYVGICIEASDNLKRLKGEEHFNKAIAILKRAIHFINNNKNITTKKRVSETYTSLGDLYNEFLYINKVSNFKLSESNYKISLKIAEEIKDSSAVANILNNIGYLHLLANKENSIDYFEKSLKYSKTRLNSSTVYSNMSAYYIQKEKLYLALKNTNKAINILLQHKSYITKNLLNRDSLKTNKNKFYLLNKLIDKGVILNKLSNYQEALETFNTCDYLLDLVRFESNNTDSKLFWQEKASLLFTEATKASNYLNDTKSALYFIEKNKAILLIENIDKQKYNPKEDIDFEIFKDLKMSKYKLDDFSNKSKIINLNELKKQISSNTILLNYIKNNDLGYVLMVSKDKESIHEICNIDELNEMVQSYLKLISIPANNKVELDLLNNLSQQISKQILPTEFNSVSDEIKKLLIIPDSNLQNIPFETLTNNGKWLIESFEISYAYSYSYLIKNSKIERNPTKQLISYAPHSFEYDNLKTLNYTLFESKQISKTFDCKIFEKDFATTSNFIDTIYDYNIINISSHADANDSIAPWIAFKEKKLFLDDIYQIKNQANLVVLSVCNSSLGEIKSGEGIFSLARGFFYSGANSVVSSLWNVNDKSNQEITVNFYKYLKEGKTKSAALRLAKLDYLKKHTLSEASPYYWSSLILIGDDAAINFQNNLLYYIILGFILVIILFFIIKKIKFVGNILIL